MSGTSHDEFSSISLGKGVITRHMGDMMGDGASKEESPDDIFRHGRRSPDVGCCHVVAVRKTCLQIADYRNGQTFTGRNSSTTVPNLANDES
jgi:hypothetical protein